MAVCLHFWGVREKGFIMYTWIQWIIDNCQLKVPGLKGKEKTADQNLPFISGGDWRTRTVDLMRVKHAL